MFMFKKHAFAHEKSNKNVEDTVIAFYTKAKPYFHKKLLSIEHQNRICCRGTFDFKDFWTIILTDNQKHYFWEYLALKSHERKR